MVFDALFFAKHQSKLLRLLNSPLIGRVVRKQLCIDEIFPIVKITPSAVHGYMGGGKFRATFYSNNQYAEALHRAGAGIWGALHVWDTLVANPLRPVWNLGFDTYSSQPDDTTGIDTFMISGSPDTNRDGDDIEVGESNTSGNKSRGLIKFDYTSIPSGSVSSSITFSLWLDRDAADNTRTLSIYRQKKAWVEAEATWNDYSSGNAWTTAGGFDSADCEQSSVASLSIAHDESTGEKQWTNWTTSLIDAQFGDSPSFANNGYLLRVDTELNDMHDYRDSSHTTASERPKMVIEYTLAVGGPPVGNIIIS